jgi:hypothetical protein
MYIIAKRKGQGDSEYIHETLEVLQRQDKLKDLDYEPANATLAHRWFGSSASFNIDTFAKQAGFTRKGKPKPEPTPQPEKPKAEAKAKGEKEPEWAERHIYSGGKDEFGHLPTFKTKGQAEKAAKGFEKKWGFYETQVYQRYPGVWGFKYRKSPEQLAKERKQEKPEAKPTFTVTTGPKRSDRAMAIDRSLLAKRVVAVDDPRWLKHPNRLDVRGIDTPVRPGVAYADRQAKRLSRRKHRGFRRIRFA